MTFGTHTKLVKKCASDHNLNGEAQQNKIQVIHSPSNYSEVIIRLNQKDMEEIMLKLLTNALKYSKPGENIWIEVELFDKLVKCKISNIPIEYKVQNREFFGIPYEYMEKVFKPFELNY